MKCKWVLLFLVKKCCVGVHDLGSVNQNDICISHAHVARHTHVNGQIMVFLFTLGHAEFNITIKF